MGLNRLIKGMDETVLAFLKKWGVISKDMLKQKYIAWYGVYAGWDKAKNAKCEK